jgi:hypothetical protein
MKHHVIASSAGLLSVAMLAATQIAMAGSVTDTGTLTAGTLDAECSGGTSIHIGFGDYLGTILGATVRPPSPAAKLSWMCGINPLLGARPIARLPV